MYAYLSTYAKRLGRKWYWGETTRACGAKRLGLKIEAKRLGGERPGGTFWGETSCYRYTHLINFLQYLALRILFAMWVMYCLGHLLWRQDKLWLVISKCSYI